MRDECEGEGDSVRFRIGFLVCLALSVAFATGLALEAPVLNGGSTWRWHYAKQPLSLAWPLLAASVVTLGVAASLGSLAKSTVRAFALLFVAAIALRFSTVSLFSMETSTPYVDYVVRSTHIGSYFAAAAQLQDTPDLLARYPGLMATLPVHATNKPPGLVLFNLPFVRIFGTEPAALAAGMVGYLCGALSLACIPLTSLLVRVAGGSRLAGYHAAALWAVAPGPAIFFPLFDPALAVLTLGLAITWILALREDRYAWSSATGVILAATVFSSFHVLVVAVYMAMIGLFAARQAPGNRYLRFLTHSVVALVVGAALHFALWIVFGFNILHVLDAALVQQAALLRHHEPRFLWDVVWNVGDFALGLAWVPMVLALVYMTRLRWELRLVDAVALSILPQVAVAAAGGMFLSETSRVWNFLMPMMLVPAALELERWPLRATVVVYAGMALLTTMLARMLVFLYAG